MKKLLMYYLALFTWIALILLAISIIGIPITLYLQEKFEWWDSPFEYVYWHY